MSIVWFNTNKELDWAVNLYGNTGLSEYNASVSTDYLSGKLQIKSQPAVEPIEEPVVEPVEEVVIGTPTTKTKGKSVGNKKSDSLRIASTEKQMKASSLFRLETISLSKLHQNTDEHLTLVPIYYLQNLLQKYFASCWKSVLTNLALLLMILTAALLCMSW